MASLDPVAFLRATPPFDALPQPVFDEAAKGLEVVFFPAGTRLWTAGGAPAEYLYVIRKGAVRLEREGETLQLLEDGEIFGFTSLISGRAALDVQVEEDLLAYRISKAEFQRLLLQASFAGHFASGLTERLKYSLERQQVANFQPDLALPVSSLVRGPAIRSPPDITVGQAAKIMATANVGSLLLDSVPPAIVTDRDFRTRVLAAGLGPDTPVIEVATSPVQMLAANTPIYEAWRILLDSGLHHLPVTRGDEIVGVVSSSDLLKSTASGPVAVMKKVERLPDRSTLPGYSQMVTEMVSALFTGGLEPTTIGGFVGRLNDTLLSRILRWAEADFGPPPCPYAWLAFGSEGRMEQMLLTDQDNALVFQDDTSDAREYFARLTERVNGDLQSAGFPRCPGGYMATKWRSPLAEWEERFIRWLETPTPQALLEASIFFDFRVAHVHGALSVDSLDRIIDRARGARTFLAAMAKSALTFHPPGGLMLRLRGESSKIDIKLNAISSIVFLARCYGIEAGARSSNTLQRLSAALDAGYIEKDTCETLSEAYRFLLRLRLREQLRTFAEGRLPTNIVVLSALSSLERSRLRDVFRAIEAWQRRAQYHYRTETF
jgi:CBS domain-containing protein